MKSDSINKLPIIALILGVIVLALGWFFIPQEFISSDPWSYSKIAYSIAENGDFGSSHAFNHRLGTILPVAATYAIFGVNILTTNLWPLISAVIILIVIWLALPDDNSKILGVVLSVVSVPLWKYSTSLYPDLIAAAFMALSVYLLINRASGDNKSKLITTGILGINFLFVAFLAKESAYWVLPLWVFAFYEDYREKSMPVYFWGSVISTGIILGALYLAFCHFIFGDAFARFRAIESLTGVHLWAWDQSSAKELIKRLTTQPLSLYYATYGIAFYLAVAATNLIPRSLRYWSYYLIFTVLFFWFGSTSFSTYEPMPLVDRMILPSFPSIVILASIMLSIAWNKFNHQRTVGPVVLFSVGVLLLGLTTSTLSFFYGAIRNPLTETRVAQFIASEISSNKASRFLLITSDQRSSFSLEQFFGYVYPDNLVVLSATTEAKRVNLYNYDKIFVFLHKGRSGFLASAYGQANADDAIESLGLPLVITDGEINLFLVPQIRRNELYDLLVSISVEK